MKREDTFRLTMIAVIAILFRQSASARQVKTGDSTNFKSVRRFVQGFYDWYASIAEAPTRSAAWESAIKSKSKIFEPKLLRAMREDAAAQAKTEEIVGLDFDPFMNTQDPDGRYTVGEVRRRGQFFLVSMYSKEMGLATPAVIAQLEKHDGHWRFSNFLYSHNQNLMAILGQLKKSRILHS